MLANEHMNFVGYLYKAIALQKSPTKFTFPKAPQWKVELCGRLLQGSLIVQVSHKGHLS